MKVLLFAIASVVLLIGAGSYFFLFKKEAPQNQLPSAPVTTPTSGYQTTVTVNTPAQPVTLRDFKKDPDTTVDSSNPGVYYLAGAFTPTQQDPSFTITYSEQTRSFAIGLWREPLAATRRSAEQLFLQKVGVTQEQACTLNYSVSAPVDVSSAYGGVQLGFSFCPGSVTLP